MKASQPVQDKLLGDMLLELKQPAEALTAYEASQLREPDRFRGLHGAGQAAAQAGQRDKARNLLHQADRAGGRGRGSSAREPGRDAVAPQADRD